jgi:hypothetical protein
MLFFWDSILATTYLLVTPMAPPRKTAGTAPNPDRDAGAGGPCVHRRHLLEQFMQGIESCHRFVEDGNPAQIMTICAVHLRQLLKGDSGAMLSFDDRIIWIYPNTRLNCCWPTTAGGIFWKPAIS